MTNENGTLSAMPLPFAQRGEFEYQGLTKRELFAAMAMQGFCAGLADKAYSTEDLAADAVKTGDALLTALERTP